MFDRAGWQLQAEVEAAGGDRIDQRAVRIEVGIEQVGRRPPGWAHQVVRPESAWIGVGHRVIADIAVRVDIRQQARRVFAQPPPRRAIIPPIEVVLQAGRLVEHPAGVAKTSTTEPKGSGTPTSIRHWQSQWHSVHRLFSVPPSRLFET